MDYTRINSNDQLDLEGVCLNKCDGLRLTYTYYLYMLNTSINTWISFTNNSYFFKSNQSESNLIILKDLFKDYPNVVYWKFKMTVDLLTYANESFTTYSSLLFYVNFSPLNGTCDAGPKQGTVETIFSISCDYWFDRDGSIASYSYYGKKRI